MYLVRAHQRGIAEGGVELLFRCCFITLWIGFVGSAMAGTKLAEFDFSKSPYTTGNLVGQDNWGRVGSNTSGTTQITGGSVILKSGSNYEQTYHPLNAISPASTGLKTYVRLEVNVKNAYRSSSGYGDYWFGLTANADQSGTSYDRIYLKKTANGLGFTFGLNAGITPQYNDERIYSFNTPYTLLLTHEPIDGTKNDKVTLSVKLASGTTEDFVSVITQSFSGMGSYSKSDGSIGSLASAGTSISDPTTLQSIGFWQRAAGTTINGASAYNQVEISKISVGNSMEAVDLSPSNPSSVYTPPTSFPFIQQLSNEKVVSLQETSGSISTLQDMIDAARTSNPDSFLVIYLKAAATYSVTTTPLVLGSKICLLGGGAIFSTSANSTASSLIRISPGSSFVSITQTTLQGGSANLYGIEAPGVSRVHLDQVTASQTGKDGFYLQGMGSTIFDNEITITRCQASLVSASGYAGIHIVDATQAVCMENTVINSSIGILIESCAHCALFNNQANFNGSTGIVLNNSTWCKVAKNRCSDNTIGFATSGSTSPNQYNFFVGNEVKGTSTGFSLGGAANILYRNKISTSLSSPISTTGGGVQRIYTTDNAYTLNSSQEYFYPPTSYNQHSALIMNGKTRTDVITPATTLSAVKTAYDAALTTNPGNFIVLHLTAPQITGDATINLNSYTSVILDGTINLNFGVTAFTATSSTHICISGGMILGGNTTGRPGLSFANCSRVIIENMTLNDFGDKSTRVLNSDVIAFAGCGTPCIVTGCTINGGAARGIWTKGNTISSTAGFILSENSISNVNMDGIDFDITTANSLAMDNTCSDNIRYGIFTEEGANLNHVIRNVCANNDIGLNVYSKDNFNTIRNIFAGNTCTGNQRGIRFGAASPLETSHNFAFNNQIYGSTSSAIDAQNIGSSNYLSQNILSGNVSNFASTTSAVLFNPPVSSFSLSTSYTDWLARYFWYGADSSLTADPNQNGLTNLMEYALSQNPLAVGSTSFPPSVVYDSITRYGPWANFTYRHNKMATDLTYEIWSSTDLKNWSLQNADGATVIAETVNPDADGDGTTELLRTRTKLDPNETKRFFKLEIRKN
jgi:parallel beta-helix repeat protein